MCCLRQSRLKCTQNEYLRKKHLRGDMMIKLCRKLGNSGNFDVWMLNVLMKLKQIHAKLHDT